MKKLAFYIILLSVALLSNACVRDYFERPFFSNNKAEDGDLVDYVISFGAPPSTEVTISTKSDLGIVRESNVFNLYLLIFDGNLSTSKKIYGHYFDGDNLIPNNAADPVQAAADAELSNWWQVTNMVAGANGQMATGEGMPTKSSGTLHIKTTQKTGCTIVAIANMNPNDLNVSASLLSTITTFEQLQALVATQIRSEVDANSGYFMMTAQVDGVDFTGGSSNYSNDDSKKLNLQRLYAKVTFNVTIGASSGIEEFIPYNWQLVNVPTCSYLLPRSADYDQQQFFTTDPFNFEKETTAKINKKDISTHSFTFYMMENRKAPNSLGSGMAWSDTNSYTYREKQESGTDPDRAFLYANENATYVILTGKIVMSTTATVGSVTIPNATLDATVTYKIHLGDFTHNGNGDFNVVRNHNYAYTITINGVNDIRAEVLGPSPTEVEPGATGDVVIANETIFTSDCHYSTQVISFHVDYMDPTHPINWYVETPFNEKGASPTDAAINGDLSKLDYKWIEFRLNEKNQYGMYTDRRVRYKPHNYSWPSGTPDSEKTMYVNELVDYLIQQRSAYSSDPASSDFDAGNKNVLKTDPTYDPVGPKITVTAFVNEYYYTENPLSGGYDPDLWKRVVNHPMRRMHILASSTTSADGESRVIGSAFTIQQRSIQSIYAVHEVSDLESAWGMEYTDDTNETGQAKFWRDSAPAENCGNTSSTNGRLNTLKLWGIINPDGSANNTTRYWEDYLKLNGTNETAQLWDKNDSENPDPSVYDYDYLRYSCLSRNRDNNGNDIIDADEIRWYMASDIQLIGVFLGSYGIEGAARLYQKSAVDQKESNLNKWRQHVVASNMYMPGTYMDSNIARVIWAEEGITGSGLQFTGSGQTANFSTRCIRNLGNVVQNNERIDITQAEDNDPVNVEPQFYIEMHRKHVNANGDIEDWSQAFDNNTFYEFDCSRLNTMSLREPIDHEMVGHDENSKMACLTRHFETAPLANCIDISTQTAYQFNGKTYDLTHYQGLNEYLDASFGGLDEDIYICPKGYRLPNVREIAVIWNMLVPLTTGDAGNSGYLGHGDGNTVPSRTYWSKGKNGSLTKVSEAWGWGMMDNKIMMAKPATTHVIQKPRCVKDLYN